MATLNSKQSVSSSYFVCNVISLAKGVISVRKKPALLLEHALSIKVL